MDPSYESARLETGVLFDDFSVANDYDAPDEDTVLTALVFVNHPTFVTIRDPVHIVACVRYCSVLVSTLIFAHRLNERSRCGHRSVH
jgi:hypothetical protein